MVRGVGTADAAGGVRLVLHSECGCLGMSQPAGVGIRVVLPSGVIGCSNYSYQSTYPPLVVHASEIFSHSVMLNFTNPSDKLQRGLNKIPLLTISFEGMSSSTPYHPKDFFS